jgi:hypothetical protein
MAKASNELIHALRQTIDRLRESENYTWGHMGRCNCGHLAQTITQRSPAEIHQLALEKAGEDWAQRALDYCPDSGYTIDHIIEQMLSLGLTPSDIIELEHLRNPDVLARLPAEKPYLSRNQKEDVLLYMTLWTEILEEDLAAEARITSLDLARQQRQSSTLALPAAKAANG